MERRPAGRRVAPGAVSPHRRGTCAGCALPPARGSPARVPASPRSACPVVPNSRRPWRGRSRMPGRDGNPVPVSPILHRGCGGHRRHDPSAIHSEPEPRSPAPGRMQQGLSRPTLRPAASRSSPQARTRRTAAADGCRGAAAERTPRTSRRIPSRWRAPNSRSPLSSRTPPSSQPRPPGAGCRSTLRRSPTSRRIRATASPRPHGRTCPPRRPCPTRGGRTSSCCRLRRRP